MPTSGDDFRDLGTLRPHLDDVLASRKHVMTANLRVIVVDDQPDIAELICVHLAHLGHVCESALTGQHALDLAACFEPHVVLLDLGLPDISGYAVARALRARPNGSRLYIAAITGWGREEDFRRTVEAGFDNHVVKPATLGVIRELVQDAALKRLRTADD